MKKLLLILILTFIIGLKAKTNIILDWFPNTNHTGIYVAKELGFYDEQNLDINIRQSTYGGSPDIVGFGSAEFGISYQEQVTYARTSPSPIPIVAVATIIKENSSGFVSLSEKNIVSPKDFEGKKYGGWGAPMEKAVITSMMIATKADPKKVSFINIGSSNIFEATKSGIDFTWIFYGWDGIEAKNKNIPINFLLLQDYVKELNSYTPVIITSEKMIKNNPQMVRKFLKATKKGYIYAIKNPKKSAEILLKYAPELDRDLVINSQKYLSKIYTDNPQKWGKMEKNIWQNYGEWMFKNGLIEKKLETDKAFTNRFLE